MAKLTEELVSSLKVKNVITLVVLHLRTYRLKYASDYFNILGSHSIITSSGKYLE